jgi:hypothetical protein
VEGQGEKVTVLYCRAWRANRTGQLKVGKRNAKTPLYVSLEGVITLVTLPRLPELNL